MIEVLLAIIVACLLFGSAAVLGFLEAAFWLFLFLAVVLIVVLALRFLAKGVIGIIDDVSESLSPPQPKIKTPPDIAGVRFTDWQDYLDWANREGRWREGTDVAQDGRAGSGQGLRPGIDGEVIPSNVMPPDTAASVRRLLREYPDQRDAILDELRWQGWRIEGL
jgi:hypothetical protein